MRIVHILPKGVIGGAEKFTLNLTAAQKDLGHYVEVAFLFGGGPLIDELEERQVKSLFFNMRHSLNLCKYPAAISRLRKFSPDIIHCHLASLGLLLALSRRKRSVVIYHEHGSILDHADFKAHIERMALRIMLRIADLTIAVSHKTKQRLIDELSLPSKLIKVIPNGIDLRPFLTTEDRGQVKKSLGIASEDFLVGTVGRLVKEKGIEDFIRVARKVHDKLPNTSFLIVGEGPEKEKLSKIVHQLHVQDIVKFLGMRSDVPRLLSAFDLLLLTSNRESFGLILLEAMARKVPIVAFAVDGVPEILKEECGVLVPPGDTALMAEKVVELLMDPLKMATLSHQGFKKVAVFDIRKVATQTIELYEMLLVARPSVGGSQNRRFLGHQ